MEMFGLVIVAVVFSVLGYYARIIEAIILAVISLLLAIFLRNGVDGYILFTAAVMFASLFGVDRWKLHREISYHRAEDLRNEILHDMENGE